MTRIGFRCDAGPSIGVGHLARCTALAEELVSRGVSVVFLGDLGGVPLARRLLGDLPLLPPLADVVVDAMVVDSYDLDPSYTSGLRAAGVLVTAIVDGPHQGLDADLYVDQNLSARGSTLCGLDYVLLRDAVRRLRPERPRRFGAAVPRVLCFAGGTDATGAAPAVAEMLLATGVPVEATVVTRLPLPSHPMINSLPPTEDLPRLAASADLVITAAGSATWELFCLGTPAALIWVAENQLMGYNATVSRGLALGLGRPDTLALRDLRDFLGDPSRRTEMAGRAWALVDGRGRERVADALLGRLGADPLG